MEQHIRQRLTEAGIPFTESYIMSNGFWGTRFLFERRLIKRVTKLFNDKLIVMAHHKQACVEVY